MPSIKLPPSEAIDDLYRAILSLRSEDECHLFFGDLFTRQELSLFSQRLQVARMLSDGCTYGAVLAAVNQQLYHHACQHKPAIRYRRLSAHS